MGKLLGFLMRTLFMVLAVGLTSFGSIRAELQEEVKAPLKRIKDVSYQYEGELQNVKFYENETNVFYYYEPIDEFVTVIYEDNSTQRVGEALRDGRIVPEDLDYYGVDYFTESKVVENIIEDTGGQAFPCIVVAFYYDTRFRYEFGAPYSDYITVYFKDGTEMNVVDALEQGKIFIKDLDEFGINYFREKRGSN